MRAAVLFVGLWIITCAAVPAKAVVVGTLSAPGDSITAPILFTGAFNSALIANNGLQFEIAPGQSGVVKLELLAGTPNIQLAAAALEGAIEVSHTLPLSVFSAGELKAGPHSFAISALATGPSAVAFKLSLTPAPSALLLAATATVIGAGWNFARRRDPGLPH